MKNITLTNGKRIGAGLPTYIVAEVNTSHFGDISNAKVMIDRVKSSGADCVKFQSWTESSLYSSEYYEKNPIARRFTSKFSLSETQLIELSEYSTSIGLDFASTPYSDDELNTLVEICKVPFVKVASMDLTNIPFLRKIAHKGLPIFLSTGMGTLSEITDAVSEIQSCGNREIVVLHCVSIYPTPDNLVNLRNLIGLQKEFPELVIGLSDHSNGELAAIAGSAIGSSVIEKHVTLDSTRIGMDNQMAMEFEDFTRLVENVRRVEVMLGNTDRMVGPLESEKALELRRSVVANRDILIGQTITLEDIDFKRPGTGIPVNQYKEVVGRVATELILRDHLIHPSQLD